MFLHVHVYSLYMNLPTLLPSPGASRGEIVIVAEEVQDSKYNIVMQLSASHLDKKDFFGKVECLEYDWRRNMYTVYGNLSLAYYLLAAVKYMYMYVCMCISWATDPTENSSIMHALGNP